MIVPGSANPLLLGQSQGYNLTRSLRFRKSGTGNLTRTPSGAGNQQTWTYSVWFKRGALTGVDDFELIGLNASASTVQYRMYFDQNGNLNVFSYSSGYQFRLISNQVFRDVSAWYHIVLAQDTTQATASNRVRVYVNGSEITSWSTATYPTQNANMNWNQASLHEIGSMQSTAYWDGQMAEINFVNALQLTPSSFGSTNAQTGVWQPAKYTGSYGTNGFYLPFTDNSALTSGSNAGLGKDFSGNGNYWNTNNISITAGSTYDSMTDVPTLTSATAANFATLNPLNAVGSTATFSNANLNLVLPDGSVSRTAFATMGVSSGKFYWEATINATAATYYPGIGVNTNLNALPTNQSGSDATGYMYLITGSKFNNGSITAYGSSYTTNDVIGVALDMDGGTITFYKNNVSQGQAFSGLSGTAVPCFIGEVNAALAVNFGQRPFSYTPPTGFVALNTYNLPTPTIGATSSSLANKNFDATLYNGTSAIQSVVNAGGFQPDFVWLKRRSGSNDNGVFDVTRGVNNYLATQTTGAEATVANSMTAFNSNGFSLGTDTTWNLSASTNVAWQWKAGGTGVSNTNGSITSTVSANTSAGFSVVTFAKGGTSTTQTVGHGLGVAPKMIITKTRNAVDNWTVYHTSIGATNYLQLNTTAASTAGNPWGNTTPTSSVFSIQDNGTATYVTYAFAEITGYSKFGSYTGNGSTDGAFIYLGFRPKYVVVKRTDTTNSWIIEDSARNPYNVANLNLIADGSAAENTNNGFFDFTSNGFKCRSTDTSVNASGGTYIYMAFAEFPFRYSLAR